MSEKKEKIFKKIFASIAIVAMMILVGYQIIFSVFDFSQKSINQNVDAETGFFKNVNSPEESALAEENQSEEILFEDRLIIEDKKLQEKIYLQVPFTSQSPYADWDELHNEACEEASLIMVDAFLKDKTVNKDSADKEIIAMVNWQIENWGEHKDLTLEEMKELAEKYFGYENIRVENNIDIEDIKTELNKGNPVVLPLAGRLIGNPYYRQPGPYYHMLVVIGYENNEFITNDPGTRRGEDYFYNREVLFNALHDWPGKGQDILTGKKSILIIEK